MAIRYRDLALVRKSATPSRSMENQVLAFNLSNPTENRATSTSWSAGLFARSLAIILTAAKP
jgi:hypothetical protein